MIYLAAVSTNQNTLESRAYKTFDHSLEYIYESLKNLAAEIVEGCDFFDRDYVQKYFTVDFFNHFNRVNCRSACGEFIIERVNRSKYQFIFIPSNIEYEYFIVCELEIMDLLD